MFAPQPVPSRFEQEFPVGLVLRPSQIRASSEDASNMVTDAKALSERFAELSCPVAILAGDADGVVNYQEQSLRLHEELFCQHARHLCRRGTHDPSRRPGSRRPSHQRFANVL